MQPIRLLKAILSDQPRYKISILVPIHLNEGGIDISDRAQRCNVVLVLEDEIASERTNNKEGNALTHAG
jgi:hypothetical protein